MEKSSSIKSRLSLIMMVLIALQTSMLIISLVFSKTFYKLNQNSFKIFENATKNQLRTSNVKIADVVGLASQTCTELNELLCGTLNKNDFDDKSYEKFILDSSKLMLKALSSQKISGVFMMLDDENPKIKKLVLDNLPATVHLRNDNIGSSVATSNAYLKTGPSLILKKLKVFGSKDWVNYRYKISQIKQNPIYKNPVKALNDYPNSDITRYGYWNIPKKNDMLDPQFITYTLPIYDSHGEVYGIFTIEFFADFISKKYFFTVEEPLKDSFFAVVKKKNTDVIDTEWLLSQSYKGKVSLSSMGELSMKNKYVDDIYQAQIGKLGKMNFNVNELKMYGDNSPFVDDGWYLAGFVNNKSLIENSKDVKVSLIGTIIAASTFSMICVLFFAGKFSQNISSLTDYLSGVSLSEKIKFDKTGITEIDELTGVIEKLSYELARSENIMSKFLEMTRLPMGGFEIRYDTGITSFTPYVGSLLGLGDSSLRLPNEKWEERLNILKSDVYSQQDNVYKYIDADKKTVYLRIKEKMIQDSIVGFIADVTDEVNERIRLTTMLKRDLLTNLYNKKGFIEESEKKLMQNKDFVGAMLFLDLDNLKYVNDTYGHDCGDNLIIAAGDYFDSLSMYGAVVSRISGDEFAIFFSGFSNREDIKDIIDINLTSARMHYLELPNAEEVAIRFSTGISWYPEDSKDLEKLLKYADYAMYESKRMEKGSITEFNFEDYMKNKYISEKSETINHLISNGLIHFAFQPVIDIKKCEIYGYEALMRSKTDAFKGPVEILEVAKYQSKLRPIERLVFKTVFKTIHKMKNTLSGKKIFINSIPTCMITPEELEKISSQYPFDVRNIVIEITEVEFDAVDEAKDILDKLRQTGIKIAVDDFGKGHSGEVRILNISPDIVKVDIDLIRDIQNDERKRTLVKNLVSYCESTDTIVLAEGVETKEELKTVKELGVDIVQGYYFAKPSFDFDVDFDSIAEKLNEV